MPVEADGQRVDFGIQALADGFERLMHDRELARRLGEAGHAAVHREYGIATMARRTCEVYKAVAEPARAL